ncbi:Eukaryotic translation initiation factor 2-alpha kinase [Phytophthora palmivora]|uniref:non-specific serine/threonine protein kinase n=1 Tax=Phytophthora palmivora TaxID=4796 RepID=A0A2P4X8R1_9STRA|nr:Eukaryotic translation initiation factor 2-alpha kinase [Phytophthora palmivora]
MAPPAPQRRERPGERSGSGLFERSNPFDTDFGEKELIAQGGFGKVYKCKSNSDGHWYAVKLEQFWFKPETYFNPSEVRDVMMNEALVLAGLDHENVCRYYNTYSDAYSYDPEDDHVASFDDLGFEMEESEEEPKIDVYIQMALYEGNSLRDWIDQRQPGEIDTAKNMHIFHQIVNGLREFCVKIGDFGLSKNTLQTSLNLHPSRYLYEEGDDSFDSLSYNSTDEEMEEVSQFSLFCAFATQMERYVVLNNVLLWYKKILAFAQPAPTFLTAASSSTKSCISIFEGLILVLPL